MKKKILLPFLCIATMPAMAQHITGKIINEQGEALPYANVFLLNYQDSTFIKGTVSDENGAFSLDGYPNGDILKVSAMGYKTNYLVCHNESIGNITLQDDAKLLGEVVVKGHRNYVKSNNMGLNVSMIGNPLSKLGSALDAIKQMPLISGIGTNISVLGKGTPEIYINHRKVRDNSELQQLSSQDIERVEIITNPGAKYEADVKSVIIIHTKNQDAGWAGLAKAGATLSDVSYGRTGLDLSWTGSNGLGVYAGANYAGDGEKQTGYYLEKFGNNKYETKTNTTYENRAHKLNANIGASYDFGANSLGIRYEFSRKPKGKYSSTNDIQTNVEPENAQLESTSEQSKQNTRHYLNSYAILKFGEKKNYQLAADMDYLYNFSNELSDVNEQGENYANHIGTVSHSNNHLVAGKANFTASWKAVTLDLGAQYSYSKTLQSFAGSTSNDEALFDASRDEERQHLTAGYITANWQLSPHGAQEQNCV